MATKIIRNNWISCSWRTSSMLSRTLQDRITLSMRNLLLILWIFSPKVTPIGKMSLWSPRRKPPTSSQNPCSRARTPRMPASTSAKKPSKRSRKASSRTNWPLYASPSKSKLKNSRPISWRRRKILPDPRHSPATWRKTVARVECFRSLWNGFSPRSIWGWLSMKVRWKTWASISSTRIILSCLCWTDLYFVNILCHLLKLNSITFFFMVIYYFCGLDKRTKVFFVHKTGQNSNCIKIT